MSRVEKSKETVSEWRDQVVDLIRENPLAAVLGALALGFLLARLTRKQKTVYVEKSEP